MADRGGPLNEKREGPAWFKSAQFCEPLVSSRHGAWYSVAKDGAKRVFGGRNSASTFYIIRFGQAMGQEVLLTGPGVFGKRTRAAVARLLVAEQEQVLRGP